MSFELETVNIKIFVGKRKYRGCQVEGTPGTPWLPCPPKWLASGSFVSRKAAGAARAVVGCPSLMGRLRKDTGEREEPGAPGKSLY